MEDSSWNPGVFSCFFPVDGGKSYFLLIKPQVEETLSMWQLKSPNKTICDNMRHTPPKQIPRPKQLGGMDISKLDK